MHLSAKLAAIALTPLAVPLPQVNAEITPNDIQQISQGVGVEGPSTPEWAEIRIEYDNSLVNTPQMTADETDAGWILTVYPDAYERDRDFAEMDVTLDSTAGLAYLTADVIHEKMHKCLDNEGEDDPSSCVHYYIDYSVATILCAWTSSEDSLRAIAIDTGDQEAADEHWQLRQPPMLSQS